MKQVNSFIAWIGGKKILRKTIISKFPDMTNIERYIEVFGGAGWVMFGKEYGKELEIFNDIDGNLVNLYRCIKYHCEELQRELEWLFISREQFFDNKSQMESRGLTDIQRAARYFLLVKISFGADRRSFGTNKKNLTNTIEYLQEIKERLKNVVIENQDFESIIKTYDREKALFYIDPPYLGTESYYDNEFVLLDHERLKNILKSLKGKFILSYNDNEFIKKLYSEFNIEQISRNNNLTNKEISKEYKELIITNY